MNFRTIVWSVFVLTAAPLPHKFAFADEHFESIYTTASDQSTERQDTFQWDEKPWIYVKSKDVPVKNNNGSIDQRLWSWEDPQINFLDANQINLSNTHSFWFNISDDKWNNIKRNGQWLVAALASVSNQIDTGTIQLSGSAAFNLTGAPSQSNIIPTQLDPPPFQLNVAPEPVSSILFLTGGLVMAGGLLRNRKKQFRF